jgi:hypothetical protein
MIIPGAVNAYSCGTVLVLEVVRGGVIVAYHSWGDREEWIRKAKKRTKSEERKVFQPFLYNVRRTVQVEME